MQFTDIKLSVISFTYAGILLAGRIREAFHGKLEVNLYTKCKTCGEGDSDPSVLMVDTSVGEWAGVQMKERNAILFIGACGIAVRAIAPFLTDKLQDSPVLVMDEKGCYVIPILSGHVGGANALARMLAEQIGAQPVITTATDLNGKFAIDLFAERSGFYIDDKDGIARVSAKVLAGQEVTVSAEKGYGCGFWAKDGMREVPYPPTSFVDIVITEKERAFDAAIVLHPREYVLGFGCKRGKREDEITRFIKKKMEENGIPMTKIYALASISQKKDEAGIAAWCRKENVLFLTYTAEELLEIEGDFTGSAFVEEQVGVDNVCERAAMKACGEGGKLIVRKYAEHGMTLAVAKRAWEMAALEPY